MQGHTDPPTPKILEEAPAANLVQAPPGSRLTRFWRTLVKPFRPYEEPSTPKVAEHVPLVPLPSLAAAAQNESKETEPEAYTSEENEAACANMWSVYIREAERYDKGLVESWKGDMDGILIFSGLFSAALTAFLIESYQTLQSDSGDRTVELLMHISQQLASPSTLAAASPDPSPPTIAALFCNILWFTSLALSLTCSLLATLVQQWARDFLHKTEMRPAPVIRARVFSFLYFGLQKFQMGAVVDAIPLVLHVSLFLFFAGLIAFLLPVNRILMYLMGAVLVLFIGLYMYFTVLPILSFDSPYHTPLSKFSWSIRQWYSNLTKPQAQLSTVSLAEAIVNHSTVSVDREVCDDRAVQWTVKSLTDDAELLPFVEAISDVICGPKGLRSQNEHMLSQILDITDAHTSIISRITNLLQSSSNPWVDEKLRIRRQNACCKALWSLAWMLCESSQKAKPPSNGGIFWFDIGTAELLKSIRDVNGYAHSAWALVRYNRLKTLKDAVMEALRGCGMDSDTPEMKALRVRDIFSGSSDEDLRGIGYRGASDLFTTLTRVRQPLQDETEALSLIEKLSTEFNWTMMQDDILLDYLCASFRARLCPHQLSQTVKAILSVESPTVSGDERWFLRHVFYNIPDPSEEESLQKADVHDVDKLVMTSLDLLPHVPHNDWAFWLSRYIASRNSDVVVQQILAHCDMTGFATASVEFHQDRSVPLTIGIYCRLRNDSLYPPIFPGQYEFANAVFPLLEPGNPDDLAALTSVKCLLLDQLRDKIFWGPPLSLEELDDVNRHPLLCADFAPIHLPAEESLTTEENVRATLRKRLEQISISILADFISISATLPAYYATQTAKTICDWDLRSFVGSIPVEKQRKFAKHTHSLAENLSKNPKTPGLEDVLGIVWKASREWLWIDDAEATEGLQSAISLYCHNDTLKAERHERRSLTRPLSERIETVLTQPDHPPSLPAASGHSEEAQTLSNASYDPADLGTSASARQPELTSENLAEDAYPDPPGSIPSLESTTANVPDLSDGAGI